VHGVAGVYRRTGLQAGRMGLQHGVCMQAPRCEWPCRAQSPWPAAAPKQARHGCPPAREARRAARERGSGSSRAPLARAPARRRQWPPSGPRCPRTGPRGARACTCQAAAPRRRAAASQAACAQQAARRMCCCASTASQPSSAPGARTRRRDGRAAAPPRQGRSPPRGRVAPPEARPAGSGRCLGQPARRTEQPKRWGGGTPQPGAGRRCPSQPRSTGRPRRAPGRAQ